MKHHIDSTINHFFRPVEDLWEQSGARIVEGYEIEPGHNETVALFDNLEVDTKRTKKKERPFKTLRSRKTIGVETTYRVVMSDGVDRFAQSLNLDDEHKMVEDAILSRGSEWMTAAGRRSFAGDHLRQTAINTGANAIHVAAAHTAGQLWPGLDWLRVPGTFDRSLHHSLAKSAFSKQSIIDYIIQDQKGEFAQNQVGIGGSMDKMEKAAERFYADQNGNPMEQEITIAPCGLEGLVPSDWPEILEWGLEEGKALPAVILERLKRGRLCRSIGTVSLNANFWVQTLIGNTPALASNEAGRIAEWLKYDSHGYTRLQNKDGMSSPNWALSSMRFPNMYYDEKDGVHVDLARVSVNDELREIAERYFEERRFHGGNLEAINRPYTYGSKLITLEDVA